MNVTFLNREQPDETDFILSGNQNLHTRFNLREHEKFAAEASDEVVLAEFNKIEVTSEDFLNLIIYQIHKYAISSNNLSYPIINLCVRYIQDNPNIKFEQHMAKKYFAEKYMVFAFKYKFKKLVGQHYGMIQAYFAQSEKGNYIDTIDIYQQLYIYFFELVHKFNCEGEVYFVTFANQFLFYWIQTFFKLQKKEEVELISLDSTLSPFSAGDGGTPLSLYDKLQDGAACGINVSTGSLDDYISDKLLLEDFYEYIDTGVHLFKNKHIYEVSKKIYFCYFIDKKRNKSQIAREIGVSQQKVRYYLDKLLRIFQTYIKEL